MSARPDPATATIEENDYVFGRAVRQQTTEGTAGSGRIDLYKRGCFVLEATQSRQAGGAKQIDVPHQPSAEPPLSAAGATPAAPGTC